MFPLLALTRQTGNVLSFLITACHFGDPTSSPICGRIQTFSHDPGGDEEVFIFEYDIDRSSYPLLADSEEYIVGAIGEEDLVAESAVSITGVAGKKVPCGQTAAVTGLMMSSAA